ncbi:MAG: hypothetical protein MSG64_18215 [Pyrinomonadaceae bacterium MAG19_C2-C3]|nr:hypothetical protein [Pyrinomonadaceae bacterium MAG19_C2-C3]
MAMSEDIKHDNSLIKVDPEIGNNGHFARLAASLAPAEEQARHGASSSDFKISKSFVDEDALGAHLFAMPHKIVVVLVLLALCFISFIAFLIARSPAPPL